eukprot:TRINITY_DN20768_c0_g1_i4.p1 TRINITY_DN20768_c0_g1~~TRINITY_DN20768_c0_g1_i4.p1  ORF type:complete len:142 (-),score=25.69 TRINITY_DN20768_c0_g1_i4:156-581(-)
MALNATCIEAACESERVALPNYRSAILEPSESFTSSTSAAEEGSLEVRSNSSDSSVINSRSAMLTVQEFRRNRTAMLLADETPRAVPSAKLQNARTAMLLASDSFDSVISADEQGAHRRRSLSELVSDGVHRLFSVHSRKV